MGGGGYGGGDFWRGRFGGGGMGGVWGGGIGVGGMGGGMARETCGVREMCEVWEGDTGRSPHWYT